MLVPLELDGTTINRRQTTTEVCYMLNITPSPEKQLHDFYFLVWQHILVYIFFFFFFFGGGGGG